MSKQNQRNRTNSGRPKSGASGKKKRSTSRETVQWIGAIIFGIILTGLIIWCTGTFTRMSGGKENPEELATAFVKALEKQDNRMLRKCLLSIEPNYEDIKQKLEQYIHSEKGIESVDYDSMTIETMNPEAISVLEKEMGVSGIEETALSCLQVPMTRKIEDSTYHVVTTYYMTAYKAKNKWYIFDVTKDLTLVQSGIDKDGNKLDPAEAYRLFNHMLIGGDEDIGYIPLDSTWYAANDPDAENSGTELPIEDSIKDLAYVQESGNALIHMVLLDSDKTAHELADQLYANLTLDKEVSAEAQIVETEINGRKTWHVGFYSPEDNLLFYSYVIDTKDYDGMLRYLSLESTQEYSAATLYLTNYLTPKEHATMYKNIEETLEQTE